MHNRGLVIFPIPGDEYREDFAAISSHIRETDPGIHVKVVHERQPGASIGAEFGGLPNLVVSFRHGVPVPVPGRLFTCRYVPKPEQIRRYAEAGIPFPRSRLFQWGLALEPSDWGPLVIMKPTLPGTMSQGLVHLMPTDVIRRLTPRNFAPNHPIHHGPMLLQSFIDTGKYPTHYRVLTLFGEPLYARATVLKQPRPSLSAPLQELLAAKIASNASPRDRIMVGDPELLAFAKRMSQALPDVPLQGLDILKEQATGRLFALENNPGGNTWHFSSKLSEKTRQEKGNSREDLIRQFNALERAAQVLANATKIYAARNIGT